jgi:hypothetical protein
MIALAWISFLISLFISYLMKDYRWLSRSGSLMVMFCAIGEYHFIKIRMPPTNSVTIKNAAGIDVPVGTRAPEGEADASLFLHATLCLGTVVLGYGDLINSLREPLIK